MAGNQREQDKKKLEEVHDWVDRDVSHFLLLHTHTHTPTAVGCSHLFNLWFLAENGGRHLIKKQCLVSDPKIKSQPDKEEEPRVQAEEVA